MKGFLQILLTLGLLAFIVGAVLDVAGKAFVFSPKGYWCGAMGFWMLLIAIRAVYSDKK